jgi:hypothetical protein
MLRYHVPRLNTYQMELWSLMTGMSTRSQQIAAASAKQKQEVKNKMKFPEIHFGRGMLRTKFLFSFSSPRIRQLNAYTRPKLLFPASFWSFSRSSRTSFYNSTPSSKYFLSSVLNILPSRLRFEDVKSKRRIAYRKLQFRLLFHWSETWFLT